ncbi:hypothetical protein ACIRU8_45580 [Streptomyces sp. NPDC101175]|uniref:hypothetical protein n=1 Tax=Streptomyces sp. NPDC101175 TaxID=3366123 RepID=UPI003838675B
MSAPARARGRKTLRDIAGLIPPPGGLLDWSDGRHFDHHGARPCVLCGGLTPLCSHQGEPVHKVCAENWIAANAVESRLGRFASDVQAKSGKGGDNHA